MSRFSNALGMESAMIGRNAWSISKQVVMQDQGLRGTSGARQVLERVNPFTTEISLAHNHLGSDGTICLFRELKRQRDKLKKDNRILDPTPTPENPFARIEARPVWRGRGDRTVGLKTMTLSGNQIGNEALLAIAEFLDGDDTLEELYLPNNHINTSQHMERFGQAVTRSKLRMLSFNSNEISGEAIALFLKGLAPEGQTPVDERWGFTSTPVRRHNLRQLHFSNCPIFGNGEDFIEGGSSSQQGEAITAIERFIGSSVRCRKLQLLALNATHIRLREYYALLRFLQELNFSLRGLEVAPGVDAEWFTDNLPHPASGADAGNLANAVASNGGSACPGLAGLATKLDEMVAATDERVSALVKAEGQEQHIRHGLDPSSSRIEYLSASAMITAASTGIADQPLAKVRGYIRAQYAGGMKTMLGRNRELHKQVRSTAVGVMPALRVVMNARKPTDAETGKTVMQDMLKKQTGAGGQADDTEKRSSTPSSFNEYTPFRLLDLPDEILALILYQLDPAGVLSEKQWKSLKAWVTDPRTLQWESTQIKSIATAYPIDVNLDALSLRAQANPGPSYAGKNEWFKDAWSAEAKQSAAKIKRDHEGLLVDAIVEEIGCDIWDDGPGIDLGD